MNDDNYDEGDGYNGSGNNDIPRALNYEYGDLVRDDAKVEEYLNAVKNGGTKVTRKLTQVYNEVRKLRDDEKKKEKDGNVSKEMKRGEKLSFVWRECLKATESEAGVARQNRPFNENTVESVINEKKREGVTGGYFERVGGLLLHETQVVGAVIRYQLLDNSLDRAKYSKIYNAMKEHLRVFYRPTYDIFQKIMWVYSYRVLSYVFSSSFLAMSRMMMDTLITNLTLGPGMVGQVLVDNFLTHVTKTLPGVQTGQPLVVIAGIMVVLSVIAEAIALYKTRDYKPVLAWMVEELNKVVVKCSYRYKGVLRIIVRIFELLGAAKTNLVMKALGVLQSPFEAFAAFSNLPTYKSLDRALNEAKSKKDLRNYMNGLMEELEKSRVVHRLAVPFSILGYRGKKKK